MLNVNENTNTILQHGLLAVKRDRARFGVSLLHRMIFVHIFLIINTFCICKTRGRIIWTYV